MAKSNSFHHGDLKRSLIDVAISLLDQHGIPGVTIRAVARGAGVSHSAPVNHYKDRRALLTAITQVQFAPSSGTFVGTIKMYGIT